MLTPCTGPICTPITNHEGASNFNPDDVLFEDSVCVSRFKSVVIKDGPGANDSVLLIDTYASTPISGDLFGFMGSQLLPDALYVVDLTVESGATLSTGAGAITGGDVNIYYTGSVSGTIKDTSGATYTPVQLTVTSFGDFDGDSEGDELADTDRFSDSWCMCQRKTTPDAAYDPLADWDCDGDVDDNDRDQYNTNWGTGTRRK